MLSRLQTGLELIPLVHSQCDFAVSLVYEGSIAKQALNHVLITCLVLGGPKIKNKITFVILLANPYLFLLPETIE